jgi:hypothetical protein
MSFRAWLAVARVTDDPEGDFVEDAKALKDYVRGKGACREAVRTVPRVWRRYEQWLDRA